MKRLILTALTVAALLRAGTSRADCALDRIAEFPVTMAGLQPTVPARINGADADFILDTGAFYSTMSAASAAQFGLRLRVAPGRLVAIEGIGGEAEVGLAVVKRFTLGKAVIPNVEFLVGGTDFGVAGLLGQNVWSIADVEYDFAGGAVRLFRPKGCNGRALAYWDATRGYSEMDLGPKTPLWPFTTGTASVNGKPIRVLFDSGAERSFLTLRAARRLGLDAKGAALVPDDDMGGVGKGVVRTWTVPVASFKIGGEEIRNTRLSVADSRVEDRDMLIGADFFLSHRILVANSQGKLYFTYNGGPVFRLEAPPPSGKADAPPVGAASPTAADAGAPKTSEPAGADLGAAGEAARRGAAFAARRQFAQAIFELTRAHRLAPGEADYAYERALAYLGAGQTALALADLDEAVKLRPDDTRFLLQRAELRLAGDDRDGTLRDLEVADRAAPKTADARLSLGLAYEEAGAPEAAIGQFDLWLDAHRADGQRPRALGARCWARVLANQALDKALADCDAALAARPAEPGILAGRGLVRLRMGDIDKAMADDEKALAVDPRLAWALYGRGLAETRQGEAAKGKADIAAALGLDPALGAVARDHGLTP